MIELASARFCLVLLLLEMVCAIGMVELVCMFGWLVGMVELVCMFGWLGVVGLFRIVAVYSVLFLLRPR